MRFSGIWKPGRHVILHGSSQSRCPRAPGRRSRGHCYAHRHAYKVAAEQSAVNDKLQAEARQATVWDQRLLATGGPKPFVADPR